MDTEKLTMKEMPVSERPYEKCIQYGTASLSDAELLAVIIRTGGRGERATELACRILNSVPGKKLGGLFQMSSGQLEEIKGIGRVKAVQLLCLTEITKRMMSQAAVETQLVCTEPCKVAAYFMPKMKFLEYEQVRLLKHRAVSIIILHNHPSGDPAPSREDVILTKRLADTGGIAGIPLLDHIIIGDNRYVSMKESGYGL